MPDFIRLSGCFVALALLAGTANALSGPTASRVKPETGEAPIVMLMDMQSGQALFAKEAERRFIPASITKVMSAYVAFEMIEAGELSERQQFTFQAEDAEKWRRVGSTMFLDAGESVPVWLLLRGITSVSANDASVVLARGAAGSIEAWTDRMNEAALALGMTDSHFNTPNGWMDEGKTFTSARDLTLLARAIITRHPAKYSRYFGHEGLNHKGIAQANHDPISGRVRGADGLKTGYTNESGFGFLGSAERNGKRLVMVVAGADRVRARDELARELIEWGFDGFDRRQIFAKGQVVGEARIQGGERNTTVLIPNSSVEIAIPAGEDPKLAMRLRYNGPLKAPIEAGQTVAELELSVEGMPTSRIPLTAGESVGKAGFMQRIWNGFVGWFT